MDTTGTARGGFLPRRLGRTPVVALVGAAVAAGCAMARNPTQTAAPAAIVVLGLPATPESTLALTRRALGEIGGTLQAVQWHATVAVLSTRYTRNRRGVGMSEIAVVATVGRTVPDSMMPLTLVELRAWAMDSLAVQRTLGAPIESPMTRVHRPRPITLEDVEEWESVEVVMRLLAQHGGRRIR